MYRYSQLIRIYLIQRQSPVPPLSSTLTNTRLMKLTHRVVLDNQMHSLFLGISFKFIDKLLDLCSGHEISNSLKEPSIYVHYLYKRLNTGMAPTCDWMIKIVKVHKLYLNSLHVSIVNRVYRSGTMKYRCENTDVSNKKWPLT